MQEHRAEPPQGEAEAAPREQAAAAFVDAAMLFVSIAAPLVAAASKVSPFADAFHDAAIVRGLGLGGTGAWRALDLPVSTLWMGLPLGTRALRAALASAALGGAGGGLLYVLARSILASDGGTKDTGTTSRAAIVAAAASLCASLSGAWLLESTSAGSPLLGVVLALAPVALAASKRSCRQVGPLLAVALGAALTYEPLVGLVAFAGSLALHLPTLELAKLATQWRRTLAGFLAGCLPFAVAIAGSRLPAHRLDGGLFRAWAGEGVSKGGPTPVELVTGELGGLLAALSVLGAVLALVHPRSRRSGGAVLAVLFASALGLVVAPSSGPDHFRAPALILLGAVAVLAAVPMHGLVAVVSRARIPLASASAFLVILLELTFPVLALDEALVRLEARPPEGTRAWDDEVFEPLPAGALLLTADPDLYARGLASRATGELRADLTLVSTLDASGDAARREVSLDPDLRPLWRELVLYGSPRERSLSSVAASRPLVLDFDPAWDRALLRHLVPIGLLAVFRPEPRGASERLAALGEEPFVPPREGALAVLTRRLLDAESKSLLALGEREAALRVEGASAPFSSFSSSSAAGEHHPRRLVAGRGTRLVTSP
jgi:hypothetical protein